MAGHRRPVVLRRQLGLRPHAGHRNLRNRRHPDRPLHSRHEIFIRVVVFAPQGILLASGRNQRQAQWSATGIRTQLGNRSQTQQSGDPHGRRRRIQGQHWRGRGSQPAGPDQRGDEAFAQRWVVGGSADGRQLLAGGTTIGLQERDPPDGGSVHIVVAGVEAAAFIAVGN